MVARPRPWVNAVGAKPGEFLPRALAAGPPAAIVSGSMASKKRTQAELNTVRDTVESIWVAIVLAFVLRAFMVEAFVIPTGSMAPRLMGEHYELQCPSCKYEFAFGCPREQMGRARARKIWSGARCPACAYPLLDRPPQTDRKLF